MLVIRLILSCIVVFLTVMVIFPLVMGKELVQWDYSRNSQRQAKAVVAQVVGVGTGIALSWLALFVLPKWQRNRRERSNSARAEQQAAATASIAHDSSTAQVSVNSSPEECETSIAGTIAAVCFFLLIPCSLALHSSDLTNPDAVGGIFAIISLGMFVMLFRGPTIFASIFASMIFLFSVITFISRPSVSPAPAAILSAVAFEAVSKYRSDDKKDQSAEAKKEA